MNSHSENINFNKIQKVSDRAYLMFLLYIAMSLIPFIVIDGVAAQNRAVSDDVLIADILEQAIFEQEVSDDPETAIPLFRKVIESAETTREIIAQAWYNLGLCYLSTNDRQEAAEAFSVVVNQYSDIDPYSALAKIQLRPAFQPQPAPWKDGERLEYEVKINNIDRVVANYFTTSYRDEWNGQRVWKLIGRATSGNGHVEIKVDDVTFRPLHSKASNEALSNASAIWSENALEVTVVGQEQPNIYNFDDVVYDAEQQFWLLRQIPMSIGHKAKIDFQSILISSRPTTFDVEVIGEETITVAAGTFDTYKLSTIGGLADFWIAKDSARTLIKVGDPTKTFELKSISHVTPGAWHTETSGISEFNISIPSEWIAVRTKENPKMSVTKTVDGEKINETESFIVERYVIADEAGDYQLNVLVNDFTGIADADGYDDTMPGRVKSATDRLKLSRQEYLIREASERDFTLNGLPAHSYIADTTIGGREVVLYATFINHGNQFVWALANFPSDKFNDMTKTKVDEIFSTIKTY